MDGGDRKVCWGQGCPDLGVLHKVDGCARTARVGRGREQLGCFRNMGKWILLS